MRYDNYHDALHSSDGLPPFFAANVPARKATPSERTKGLDEARKAMERSGLSLRGAFKDKNVWQIQDGVRLLTGRLKASGQIRAQYSAHDLRHSFAKRYYEATKDIYRLSKLLGHVDISTTQLYLRSLGVEELK